MLEAEACSLYLVDDNKEELYFEFALGEKGHLLKKIKVKNKYFFTFSLLFI